MLVTKTHALFNEDMQFNVSEFPTGPNWGRKMDFRQNFYEPSKKMIIKVPKIIDFFEFILPSGMRDMDIRLMTEAKPMSIRKFWLIYAIFIFKPEIGKKYFDYELDHTSHYLMHIDLGTKILSFNTYYDKFNKKFVLHCRELNIGLNWGEKTKFLWI